MNTSRDMNAWIVRPFSVEEGVIKDEDVTAKVEFLSLREHNTLKVDFRDSDLTTFWRNHT